MKRAILCVGKPFVDNLMRMLDIEPPNEVEKLVDGNTRYYVEKES